ncbi:phage major capsid protein, HK97 family [Moraxella cuniculi DSM 21768]|uniref:Phage major capsid protein, HK97 family n=1 Tax=Moraxella cuniculi DSM 21768 TaxID=1122245 RepID=A0A1N7G4H8_9GAMM|nr:phage major capsid protein [Moraxella cuniculi]OOS03262.1 capsid protein [Moraxella cuniculi]SIS07499.1 phage major capsid protein, HK97 family [Moraxella cuniculi DSM 21768]
MTDITKELAIELKTATDKIKNLGEELQGRMEKGETALTTLKGDVDEALTAMNEIKSRLDDVEQKQARRGEHSEPTQSIGQQLYDSEQFKSFVSNPRAGRDAKLELKATITSLTTDTDGAAGALVQTQRLGGIIAPPDQRLRVRDLLMAGTTDSNAIEYVKETGFVNGAAAQANEGDKKAQSHIKFGTETVNVRTLAHYVKASRQILDDASMLQSYINGRLSYGLKLVEDRQLLNGDGENGNLKGIIPQATAFADKASMASYTILNQLRLAQLQAVLAEYPASGYVLNPIDWAKIELLKDGDGRNIIGIPQGVANRTLWGLPVVETTAMQTGKFLTGAFNMGAQIFDRQTLSIAVATENEDDFVRNLVTILCEERLALAVYRPEAFIYGDLAAK